MLVWFRQEKIPLPVLTVGDAAERIVWKAPVYSTVHHILTNPVYAGAYAFGRRTMRVVIENGRKHVLRNMQRDWRSWSVLIPDHHESYISWTDFERNQTLIADNANGKRFMSRGAIRRGEALLVGLFRCARCGRKLRVRYSDGAGRYQCVGAFSHLAAARCISFSGMRADRMVAKEVLERLQPLGVEAALAAIDARSHRRSEKQGQLEFALQQARYEAARVQRQYDAADPDNRLVAGELERRWNERLVVVRHLEAELDQLRAEQVEALTVADRDRLMMLGRDLTQAWDSPGATAETRKKIIRTVITEIIVDVVGDSLELLIHWQGGDHTRLGVKKNKFGHTRWVTDTDIVDLVRALARHMPDHAIAMVLNRSGKTTTHGHSWTRGSVCSLRHNNDIAIHRPGERAERGEATINEAAAILSVSTSTVRRLIAERALSASQTCKGAPWIIPHADGGGGHCARPLVPIVIEGSPTEPSMPMSAIYRADAPPGRAGRWLIDHLKAPQERSPRRLTGRKSRSDPGVPVVEIATEYRSPITRNTSQVTSPSAPPSKRRTCLVLQQNGGAFADDDAGRHGVPGRHSRHDRGVRDPEALDPMDLKRRVHDRHFVEPHSRGSALVPERDEAVAYELLQLNSIEFSGRNLARGVWAKSRRIADLTGLLDANHQVLQVIQVRQIIRLNIEGIGGVRTGKANGATTAVSSARRRPSAIVLSAPPKASRWG